MAKDEKFNFERDERVLCYHGPFIYEAKVMKEITVNGKKTHAVYSRF